MSSMTEQKRYTTSELEAMPTLRVGQMDDLKIDTGTERVWLSRMTREDGAEYDRAVTIERFDTKNGAWLTVEEYDGNEA